MRASLPTLMLAALLVLPSPVRADSVSPPLPCPPGTSRTLGGPTGGIGALWGHGPRPDCEPVECRDASTCPAGMQCREDRHCIQSRTDRVLRPSHGHSAPRDPDDPASWHDVTTFFDAGRCAEGNTCEPGWRCLAVSTCRPEGEADSMPLSGLGSTGAQRAWQRARPVDDASNASDVAPTEATPEPVAQHLEPAAAAEQTEEPEATAEVPPAASGCGCRAVVQPSTPWGWLLVAAFFVLRRRRSPPLGRARSGGAPS